MGNVLIMGAGVILWSSKIQPSIALSSSKTKYMVVTITAYQVVYIRKILADMKQVQGKATTIYYDNQSTIPMTKNLVYHNRTRYIDTRHHFITELVAKGDIKMEYCNTNDHVADLLTNPLPMEKFIYLRKLLGIKNVYIKKNCKQIKVEILFFCLLLIQYI